MKNPRPSQSFPPSKLARAFSQSFQLILMIFGLSMARLTAAVQATFYVSPTGSGNVGSLEAPCSLEGARDLVRTVNGNMTGDIVIYLRGGTYELNSSFQLTETGTLHDSGTNGHDIIYQAYSQETPIISGGTEVTGWTLFDKTKNIYRAKVDPALRTRQLYVNGLRATRARSALQPPGWTKTATGWNITDASMQNWGNKSDIELVCRDEWKHLRCGIASIVGTTVRMKDPGWANASDDHNSFGHCMGAVTWIENAYELLNGPGQWYLDTSAGYLYYLPREGEDMKQATVVAARLEKLLEVQGSDTKTKIHNLKFIGLNFRYGTWMRPSGEQGYASYQAGITWMDVPAVGRKPDGNLSFQYASDIQFIKNSVAHMGGVAVDFGHGAQRNTILGNCIYDISGGGIYLGNIDDESTQDPEVMTDSNIIKDNYITKVGVEYEDQVGIWVGYSRNLLLDHNEVYDVPYSGISVGWGWGKVGYGFKNTFSNNFIHDYMKVLRDGGGIYTLSNQGDAENKTIWSGNYLLKSNNGQGLYPDEGSGWMELNNNLVLDVGVEWLHLWTNSIHDVSVHDNFSDQPNQKNAGTNCPMADNKLDVKRDNLPEAAQAIVKNAGLEPEFIEIKKQVPALPPYQ